MDDRFWEEVLEELRKVLSEQEVSTWLAPLTTVEVRGDIIVLGAPNRFYKNWVDQKYLLVIKEVLRSSFSIESDVEVIVAGGGGAAQQPQPQEAVYAPVCVSSNTNLNRQYTFEQFVAGNSNQFAYNSCLSIADGNFHSYNPLFLYGGVGLGKTHLMHAVGNRLIEKYPKMRILYVTSESYTNEMIQSLRTNRMDDFREKYRSIDLLLFDDVQFLSGKERTAEEFFHTFNSLYDTQKQIILTSDKTPRDLQGMEERMTSRFSWGLIADIQSPSTEEKVAILLKHADIKNIPLPNDVAFYLAQNMKCDNVREMIGSLIRLHAYASFQNKPISIELANSVLDRFLMKRDKVVTDEEILSAVSSIFNVKIADMKSKKRTKSISYPRQIAMYLLRDKMNISLAEVGGIFGGRDHSTVLHAVTTVEKRLKSDPELQELISTIVNKLYS